MKAYLERGVVGGIRAAIPRPLKTTGRRILRRPLYEFRYNVYSQNGEDGVIEELFYRLNIKTGWAVEFGAWDGIRYSNTYKLVETDRAFQAVYIEGDLSRYHELCATAARLHGRIIPIHAFVQPTGEAALGKLLRRTPIPPEFELLSIDVDSIDYQIWEKFEEYSPKIVIIEINSSVPPDRKQTHGPDRQGSSFRSTLELGVQKGYTFVCHTGNMIFVRSDLAPQIDLRKAHLQNPTLLFKRDWLPRHSVGVGEE